MSLATREQLLTLCREVIAPLLKADGGVLYVVTVDDETLSLHLAGTCAGCPGAPITSKNVIEPAVKTLAPHVKLTVTAGARIPVGATLLDPDANVKDPG